ncbi:MAG TPA: alpha/beta fold hydrolase [Gemmatimonadaceae bacterium]|nr:alpha/beta fold hydrolase [Gemmatimonadaceae bacterium]
MRRPTPAWQKIALSSGAAVGAAAIFNALVRRGVSRLANPIGGEEGGFSWRGRRIAFTVRGSGPPILLVHSIGPVSWSYEWRNNADALARSNTVYTLDLLGFGRSDRPAVRYSARVFISLISDFAAQVIGQPCVLVASSLSAAYAVVLGARDPHRFPALVLVQSAGLVKPSEVPRITGEARRFTVEAPLVGTAIFNTLMSRRGVRAHLERLYTDDTNVTQELVEMSYQTAHQKGARRAPAAFFTGHLNIDVARALRRVTQPMLLIWGEEGSVVPLDEATRIRALQPKADLQILSPAGDLPHDERAEDFNVIVATWLTRQSLSSAPTPGTPPGTLVGSQRTSQP